jgi:hypothetical protein
MSWDLWFHAMYRLIRLLDPVLRVAWRRRAPLFGRVVDLRVAGLRSGRERRTLLTLVTVDGRWYVGHPNGGAAWTRNLAAAGRATVIFGDGSRREVGSVRLFGSPELEAVVRATWWQQPFPGNVVYALARHHVRRVGHYFRLNPLGVDGAS